MGENRREKWRMERVAGGNQGVMHTELEPSALLANDTAAPPFVQDWMNFLNKLCTSNSLYCHGAYRTAAENKHSIKGWELGATIPKTG